MVPHINIRTLIDQGDALGESPVWSAREQALYWVDILNPRICRWDALSKQVSHWPMPQTIGSIGLCANGEILAALRDGVYMFSPEPGRLSKLAAPDTVPTNRLNDGKVSPEGRFWIGSMDDRPDKQPVAALFCMEPNFRTSRKVEALRVSNGLAWSPDGRVMYHSDSRAASVWAYDYDPASGEISGRRSFINYLPEWGRPDGAAVDRDGCYWSAGVTMGRLNRFDPDGKLMDFVQFPVSHITMPCFGGPELKTLFVTSSRAEVPEEHRATMPLAGALFALDLDVAGAPVGEFLGEQPQ